MKTLRWNITAVLLVVFTATIWSGCSDDKDVILDCPPLPEYRIYKGDVPVSDTIRGFNSDCVIEIPAEGGTYRIKFLPAGKWFESYEIVQPINYRGLLRVVTDGSNPPYANYDVTYAPNGTGASRLMTIKCYSRMGVLLVSAYQPAAH